MSKTFIAGVGMIAFTKPGANEPYHQMAAKAGALALQDAGVDFPRYNKLTSATYMVIRRAGKGRSMSLV